MKIKCEFCGTYYNPKAKNKCPNCGAINEIPEDNEDYVKDYNGDDFVPLFTDKQEQLIKKALFIGFCLLVFLVFSILLIGFPF